MKKNDPAAQTAQALFDAIRASGLDHPDHAVLELHCPYDKPYDHLVARLVQHEPGGVLMIARRARREPLSSGAGDGWQIEDGCLSVICDVCGVWVHADTVTVHREMNVVAGFVPEGEEEERVGTYVLPYS